MFRNDDLIVEGTFSLFPAVSHIMCFVQEKCVCSEYPSVCFLCGCVYVHKQLQNHDFHPLVLSEVHEVSPEGQETIFVSVRIKMERKEEKYIKQTSEK